MPVIVFAAAVPAAGAAGRGGRVRIKSLAEMLLSGVLDMDGAHGVPPASLIASVYRRYLFLRRFWICTRESQSFRYWPP